MRSRAKAAAFDAHAQFAQSEDMERPPMAVVESKAFLEQAKPLMSDSERVGLVAGYALWEAS